MTSITDHYLDLSLMAAEEEQKTAKTPNVTMTVAIEPSQELLSLVDEMAQIAARVADREESFTVRPVLRVKRLSSTAKLPRRADPQAIGLDLHADLEGEGFSLIIAPGERFRVKTGIALAVPPGYYGRVAPRSGLAVKQGIDVLAGVVDEGYTGDVSVILLNTGNKPVPVKHGDRIAQLILERADRLEVVEVDELPASERGEKGFGSSGVAA